MTAELEIEVLRKENERIGRVRQEQDRLVTELQGRTFLLEQKLHADEKKQQSPASAEFGAVTKEQLRNELLQAALSQQTLEKTVRDLETEKSRLEETVVQLMRQNQKLSDELEDAKPRDANSSFAEDAFNTSLADELTASLMEFGDSNPASPIKVTPAPARQPKALFADMEVVSGASLAAPSKRLGDNNNNEVSAPSAVTQTSALKAEPQLFQGLDIKDDDRQYRDYVYMTVTAVKVGLAIRYASNPTAADRACEIRPKAVFKKAVEMRVALHQVHAFVRKYAQAYVEKTPPRAQPQPQGLLSRVLSFFPGADYLTRPAEVVPNRGSEVGSFLHKKGTFLSRSWKMRWFKLNTQIGVISYHTSPDIFEALGTIPLQDVGRIEEAPPQPPYQYVFVIYTVQGREFWLAADSESFRRIWIDGVRTALADIALDRLATK